MDIVIRVINQHTTLVFQVVDMLVSWKIDQKLNIVRWWIAWPNNQLQFGHIGGWVESH
jgi:hypothetical protein